MNTPPPYDGDHASHFSEWTEEQVATAVGKIGPSKAWKRYAALCIEQELDGPTMLSITVENLVKYKFKDVHAQAVIEFFQKPTPAPTPTPSIGLTEQDMKTMAPLVSIREQCQQSCQRLEQVLAKLKVQQESHLACVDEWFENAQTILKQSHATATDDIEAQFAATQIALTKHLKIARQAEQNTQEREQKCLRLPAASLSDIQQRTATIAGLVGECLDFCIPELKEDPSLTVTFAPALVPFFSAEGDLSAVVEICFPSPQVSSKIVSLAMPISWSKAFRSAIDVKENSLSKTTGDQWDGIIGEAVFSSGSHTCSFVPTRYAGANTWKMIVGVVPADLDVKSMLGFHGQGTKSLGFCPFTGRFVRGGTKEQTKVEAAVAIGTAMRFVLDVDAGTLSFSQDDNQIWQENVDVVGPLRLWVSLCDADVQFD